MTQEEIILKCPDCVKFDLKIVNEKFDCKCQAFPILHWHALTYCKRCEGHYDIKKRDDIKLLHIRPIRIARVR
jgi:hypothetical protein